MLPNGMVWLIISASYVFQQQLVTLLPSLFMSLRGMDKLKGVLRSFIALLR